MQSTEDGEQNRILFVGKVKLLSNNKLEQKVLVVDLNGGYLYKGTSIQNKKLSLGRQNMNSWESLEVPISNFPILPETEVYQISEKDPDINQYLLKLKTSKQKSEVVCMYANTRQGVIFPVIFASRKISSQFHQAVLTYQLYHKYFPAFQAMRQTKKLSIPMNLKLFQSIAKFVVFQDFVIDPEILSHIEFEDFQLKIIKQSIQRLSIRSELRSSIVPNRSNIPLKPTLFTLRLRFFIGDQVALSYLNSVITKETIKKNVIQFDICGCGVNDKILTIMFQQNERKKGSFILDPEQSQYANLMRLDLSRNSLTDLCFNSLSTLVKCTRKLTDISLSQNHIKLQSITDLKKEDKQNGRMSLVSVATMRLSIDKQMNQSRVGKNEPLFVNFLSSLQNVPLNYLNLDNNQISNPQILVTYIIEAENVPLNYLSVKENCISQVDKIRLAKLLMTETKNRGENERIPIINFGSICVIDQQVYHYVLLLKEKTELLKLEQLKNSDIEKQEIQNRRSSMLVEPFSVYDLQRAESNKVSSLKLKVSANNQWEICDQQGMLQVNNLFKSRRKSRRKSQIVNSMIMSNYSLSPSNSSSSLLIGNSRMLQRDGQVTHQTLRPTVKLLNQAYKIKNYQAIGLYKKLLKQYNQQLYNRKIAPLFTEYEEKQKMEKKQIIKTLDYLVNWDMGKGDELRLNDKLESIVEKFFRRRINWQPFNQIILYEDLDEEEQEELEGQFGYNCFAFLIKLKMRRDQMIEELLKDKYNPFQRIQASFMKSDNLFQDYFISHHSYVCLDNYQEILNNLLALQKLPQVKQQVKLDNKSYPTTQQLIHNLMKQNYLQKHLIYNQLQSINIQQDTINKDERFLCSVEPKLMFTGYLTQFYNMRCFQSKRKKYKNLLSIINVQALEPFPKTANPINIGIDNYLQFFVKYDIFSGKNLCLNPTIPISQLSTFEGLKIGIYNPQFEAALEKFSQIVVAFLKFLHHSPQALLPETLQYLNYIINTVVSEKNQFNAECLGTEFYLQLITFHVNQNSQIRAKQVSSQVLLTLVQFCSYYMKCHQELQNYLFAHVLRAQIVSNKGLGFNVNSSCRMIRSSDVRFRSREDLLDPGLVNFLLIKSKLNGLQIPLQIYYYDPKCTSQDQYGLGCDKMQVKVHLLNSLKEVLFKIQETGITRSWQFDQKNTNKIRQSKNWGLFLFNTENHKFNLILPSSKKDINVYGLFKQQIITEKQTKKIIMVVKPLLLPLLSPCLKINSFVQYDWWFRQIFTGFRQYGSYLPLITPRSSYFQLVSVVVDCVTLHFLIEQKESYDQILKDKALNITDYVQEVALEYDINLESYCPKGTAVSFSTEQKQFIVEQIQKSIKKCLEELLDNVDAHKLVLSNLYKFENKCRLITGFTGLADSITQQQLLFTNFGLIKINKTIYVEAFYWRNVYDIVVNYANDGLIKQIQFRLQQTDGVKKKLAIQVNKLADSQIFGNALLILIKNLAISILKQTNEVLYYRISNNFEFNEKLAKNDIQIQNIPNLWIWDEIMSQFQYIERSKQSKIQKQKTEAEAESPRTPKIVKQFLSSSLNVEPLKEEKIVDRITDQKNHGHSFNGHKEKKKQQGKSEQKEQYQQDRRQTDRFYKGKDQIQLIEKKSSRPLAQSEKSISQPQSNLRESNNLRAGEQKASSEIQINNVINSVPDKVQSQDHEELVITNTRKSNRRSLPKKRSSRDS